VSDLANHLTDVFRLFGPIEVRRMFGGYGVYREGIMFALLSGDALYLKADAENAPLFRKRDLPQFEYYRKGKVAKLSYYAAPEIVMEDCTEAARWGRSSFDAALRGLAAKRRASKGPGHV
jgi:DNA transformation protein